MALIKCPECGKEISDNALNCPHCGYPVRQTPPPMPKGPTPPSGMPAPKQRGHFVKIIMYIILGIWTLWCLIGIAGNHAHYNADDWIAIILITVSPYLILWYPAHRKAKKDEKARQNIIKETGTVENSTRSTLSNPIHQTINHAATQPIPKQTNAINESAVEKLETAQKKLNESLNQLNKAISSGNIIKATVQQDDSPNVTPKPEVSYIENGRIITRTDGEEITDDEVPYLIQVGREKAISKWKIQELTRLIPESYRIAQTTDNPETLCSRYNFIVEKIDELASIKQKGLLDANTFNQYSALISDDNFYNLIIICYHKYVVKAKSELKTQNGINNRINKFWDVVYHNVNTKFYNEKFKKAKPELIK